MAARIVKGGNDEGEPPTFSPTLVITLGKPSNGSKLGKGWVGNVNLHLLLWEFCLCFNTTMLKHNMVGRKQTQNSHHTHNHANVAVTFLQANVFAK